ncbi:hypothetical protein Gotur_015067 [Gossypium turneri]
MGSLGYRHHAICIYFPAQGHINPMLKLAKILQQKGFYITFVNTEFNHKPVTSSALVLNNHVDESELKQIGSNLWKEELECLQWLDSREPNSVVYMNFRSITMMIADQPTEFAWGLANRKQPFLWNLALDTGYKITRKGNLARSN